MPGEYSLAIQNLVNIVETVLGDKATKNGKIDLDNKDEVSVFTTMLEETRKNNPNVKFDEHEIARILGLEKSEATRPPQITTKIRKDINGDVSEYNEKGQKIKQIRFIGNNCFGVFMFKYDEKGQLVKETFDEGNDGKIDNITTFEYDEHGNRTKEIRTNGDGKITYVNTVEYDEKGNEIKETTDLNGDGKVDITRNYEYDEKGNEIKRTIDNNGDGKPDFIGVSEYDTNGKRTRATSYDGNGKIIGVSEE